MLKNSLFLKIVLIFTLPALGIMYFTTLLVYEKIDSMKEIYKTYDNLSYMQSTEKLIHNIQKERGLSVSYEKSRYNLLELNNQRKLTDESYTNYINYVNSFLQENRENSLIEQDIKQIQNNYYNLAVLRDKIEKSNLNTMDILRGYSHINRLLLDSISLLKNVKSAVSFNEQFVNVYNFLVYKENVGLERALISLAILNNNIDDEINEELLKAQVLQNINHDTFQAHSSIKILEIYNKNISIDLEKQIKEIKSNLKDYIKKQNLDSTNWWNLSTSRIDLLDTIFENIVEELKRTSLKTQKQAFIEQNMSLAFLFICFATLISLFFVLKKIIFDERRSVEKIEKQKKIYELLNKTNKYLLKKNNKSELYNEIHKLISENSGIVFSFIYDLEEEKESKRVYAQDGLLKDFLVSKLEEYRSTNSDNLLTKVIEHKSNIIVESFEEKNLSVFSKYATKYEIKSAAAFPIKKFGKVVSALVIYSNEDKFFDYEIEILFDKMILDLNHVLERLDYEKLRIQQENELRITSVAFESSEPMIITDENAKIINVNQAFCEYMSYSRQKLIGRNPRIFKSIHQNGEFFEKLWEKLKKNDSWSGEIYNTTGKGEIIPVRLTITAIRNIKGQITNYLGQYFDIREQIDHQKILEYRATHDNLTGLPNRVLLLDRIERAITKAVRHKIVGGLIFIDMDNFKKINDDLGHDVGDTLLITVAKKLKEAVREEDTVSRIGGDEFIVLTDSIGITKEDARKNIEVVAKKIKDALNSIEYIDGHKNISTPSIGVTLFNDDSVEVKDIIKQADTAMYVAKKHGKNCIEFF